MPKARLLDVLFQKAAEVDPAAVPVPLYDTNYTPQGMEDMKQKRFTDLMQVAKLSLLAGGAVGGASFLPQLFVPKKKRKLTPSESHYVTLGPDVAHMPKQAGIRTALSNAAGYAIKPILKHPVAAGLVGTALAINTDNIKNGVREVKSALPAVAESARKALEVSSAKIKNGVREVASMLPTTSAPLPTTAPPREPAPATLGSGLRDFFVKNFIPGEQNARSFTGLYGPGLAAAAVGIPAYAGYRLISGLGEDNIEDERDDEVTEAEKEFQRARALQYKHLMQDKNASVIFDELHAKVAADTIFDGIKKLVEVPYVSTYGQAASSTMGLPPQEAWRTLLGLGLMTGGVGGALAARHGYNAATDKSKDDIASEVLKERENRRSLQPYAALPNLYATTKPVLEDANYT